MYALQASIAAKHAVAPSEADTDWAAIAASYERLTELLASPVLEVNRSVAVGMAFGPERGLEVLDAIESPDQLDGFMPLHAARADLSRRAGRLDAAADSYRKAISLAENSSQRTQLERQLKQLGD